MAQTDELVENVKKVGERLLSSAITHAEEVGGGRNSRVYRLIAEPFQQYALKVYFRHRSDTRARLQTEFESLGFLWTNGVRNIPKPVARSTDEGIAIYDWIEGRRIGVEHATRPFICAAASFLGHLAELRSCPEAGSFAPASEAFFSGPALLENLHHRLQPLLCRHDHPGLQTYLHSEFLPALRQISEWSQRCLGAGFTSELAGDARILSPSDFGFHNALHSDSGEVFFLDFEYFGWDDPAKTLSDFLLHPAMCLSPALKCEFAARVIQVVSFDTDLRRRARALYPLFGLKWCLILLNEFLPDQLARRRFAGIIDQEPRRKEEQLAKARSKLQQTLTEYEHVPYFD